MSVVVEKIKQITKNVLFFMVFIAALYIGVGGMISSDFDDRLLALDVMKPGNDDNTPVNTGLIVVPNKLELRKTALLNQREKFFRFYAWVEDVPQLLLLLITCCAFSMVGVMISYCNSYLFQMNGLDRASSFTILANGIFVGLIIFGLSHLLPVIFVRDGNKITPISLMFLCLFGGIYAKKLFEKLSGYVDQMLKK